MEYSQINEIVETAVNNLSRVAEVNTIIGKPLVTMDGTTILPISQVSFAFIAGGGEYQNGNGKKAFAKASVFDNNFAGGSGGGATITPVSFVVVDKNGVKVVSADSSNTVEKIFDVARDIGNAFKN